MPRLLQHVSCATSFMYLSTLLFPIHLRVIQKLVAFLFIFDIYAELRFLVTRKLLWYVATARRCCVSLLVGVPDLQRAALSEERAIDYEYDLDGSRSLFVAALINCRIE